jgi:hypothetical protein
LRELGGLRRRIDQLVTGLQEENGSRHQ